MKKSSILTILSVLTLSFRDCSPYGAGVILHRQYKICLCYANFTICFNAVSLSHGCSLRGTKLRIMGIVNGP